MRFRYAACGLGVCLVAASGCGTGVETKSAAGTEIKRIPVTVAELRRQPVERTVEIVGTLKGWEEVTVGSKRVGRVAKILHDMGDRIQPGDPIVELELVDVDLAVQQAESRYLGELVKLGVTRKQAEDFLSRFGITERIFRGDEAERLITEVPAVVQSRVALERVQRNLTRERSLSQRGAGTFQDLQNAENDHDAAKAALDNAILTARTVIANAVTSRVALDVAKQARLDMVIRAPIPSTPPKGTTGALVYALTKRMVSEGQMLREGEPVAELAIENPLRLWSNVPERFSADVKLNQAVRLTVAARPDQAFQGRVARINPAVDPVSRTFQVESWVPNDLGLLRPGGFAKASIITARDAQAMVVPLESVVHFAGVTKVFIIDSNTAREIPVETGIEGQGWIEVKGDVPTHAQVVTNGHTQLAEGTAVVIRRPDETPSRPQQ